MEEKRGETVERSKERGKEVKLSLSMFKKALHESVGLFFIPVTSIHDYTNKSKGL